MSTFAPPSSQLTDTASSVQTESAHILNAALFWTAAVVAARRILYSPTFLPASRTSLIFHFSVFRTELSFFFFFFKSSINSSALVWCSFVSILLYVCVYVCVFFFFSVCVHVAGCVAPSVCVWQGECMSDRTAPCVTVLLSAPASTKTTHSASCSSPGLTPGRLRISSLDLSGAECLLWRRWMQCQPVFEPGPQDF